MSIVPAENSVARTESRTGTWDMVITSLMNQHLDHLYPDVRNVWIQSVQKFEAADLKYRDAKREQLKAAQDRVKTEICHKMTLERSSAKEEQMTKEAELTHAVAVQQLQEEIMAKKKEEEQLRKEIRLIREGFSSIALAEAIKKQCDVVSAARAEFSRNWARNDIVRAYQDPFKQALKLRMEKEMQDGIRATLQSLLKQAEKSAQS